MPISTWFRASSSKAWAGDRWEKSLRAPWHVDWVARLTMVASSPLFRTSTPRCYYFQVSSFSNISEKRWAVKCAKDVSHRLDQLCFEVVHYKPKLRVVYLFTHHAWFCVLWLASVESCSWIDIWAWIRVVILQKINLAVNVVFQHQHFFSPHH